MKTRHLLAVSFIAVFTSAYAVNVGWSEWVAIVAMCGAGLCSAFIGDRIDETRKEREPT